MRKKSIAVILGGGQGKRLFPLTKMRSKPAVPIAGKYRLVDIPISNCMNSDIRRIYVLTQYNSASLNRHIKNTYNFDVFSQGFVDILAAEQTPQSKTWYQGTADAVRQSIHHMENHDHEHVVVLSGDQLYQMDYSEMMDYHEQQDADLTIATIPVTAETATDLGIMKTNENDVINDFTEKPDAEELEHWTSQTQPKFSDSGRVYLASMGIYIFKKEVLSRLLDDHDEATDFGKEIIPRAIAANVDVHSYEFDGYWADIGTIRSFFEANLALTDDLPQFNLYDNEDIIYTHARMLPASKLSGTTFDHSILSEGCIIKASKITHSVVGIRSRIGEETEIEDAILMGNDFFPSYEEINSEDRDPPPMAIGNNCKISNAIIDKNCRIGNDVQISGGQHLAAGEYDNYQVVDGIVIVPKGSVISDGMSIG